VHIVTTVVVIAAETVVIVATAIATKTSRATVGALTTAVVTAVALTALTFTAAAVATVQRLATGASRYCRYVVDEIIPPEASRWSSIVVTSPAGPVSLL
jgi:hypothetical protein